MPRANRGVLLAGAVLVLVGLVLLLHNYHMVPDSLVQWWPVLVLGAGLWLLGRGLAERRGGRVVVGTVLGALGGFWLLGNLGRMDERLFIPILLIALGVGWLLRSLLASRA